jgi:hypothetical protein
MASAHGWPRRGSVQEPIAGRVLQGGFLKLHIIDIQSPPTYEAEVFIGFDAKADDFIAHW